MDRRIRETIEIRDTLTDDGAKQFAGRPTRSWWICELSRDLTAEECASCLLDGMPVEE